MSEPAPKGSNDVPDSAAQVGVTIKYTFLDYFRSRRYFILLAIALAITLALTIVVAHYRPAAFVTKGDPLGFYSSWWGTSSNIAIILAAIFFGGDAISGEFQNRTGYFTLPNPIRRSSVYIGKFIAAFLAASSILIIVVVITILNGAYYFGADVPYQFVESFFFSWFYLATVLGLTFFFSSLFKSSSISILVSVILLFFGFTVIQELVANIAQIEPWFVLTYGSGIISNILESPYPAHITTQSGVFGRGGPNAATFTVYNSTVPEGLVIMAAYFVITAVLGLVLFERKEFN